jgi:hypothetical protein
VLPSPKAPQTTIVRYRRGGSSACIGERGRLPEASKPPCERHRASDGAELALRSRILELDPLEQRVTLEMHAERWRDHALTSTCTSRTSCS